MRYLKMFCLAVSLTMCVVAIKTSLESNLFTEFGRLIKEPWMLATLIDFYFLILAISLWVYITERSRVKALAWIAGFVVLGSIAVWMHVFVRLRRWDGNQLSDFFIGRKS